MTARRARPTQGVEIRERHRRTGEAYYTYRVRFRDAQGERRSREFDTPEDAKDFRAHLRLLERRGELATLDAGRQTLAQFMPEWWALYAKQHLALNTRRAYRVLWNRHLLPRLGDLQLRQLSPVVLAQFMADLEQAGVGAPAIRSTMALLQAMLREAVTWGVLSANPAKGLRRPAAPRTRAVNALGPATVERLREHMLATSPAHGHRDATLISVLGYAGLRPQEAIALEARHVRRSTLLIEQKLVHGEILAGQKTGRPPRTVALLGPLGTDLREYMLAHAIRDGLLFARRTDGRPWQDVDWRNWRAHIFQPAAIAVGLGNLEEYERDGRPHRRYTGAVPYDLRHSFASLLLHEGELSVAEIAEQLGHGIETLLGHYAHVIAELKGQPRVPAEQAIRDARAASRGRHGGATRTG